MLRSGTSVGANYRAACVDHGVRPSSFPRSVSFSKRRMKTVFWLDLLLDAKVFPRNKIDDLLAEADELTSIFVTSLRTSKGVTSTF